MGQIKFTESPQWHETGVVGDHGRQILVALQPKCLLLRLKGLRATLELPFGVAYVRAAFLESDAQRAKKGTSHTVRRGALI